MIRLVEWLMRRHLVVGHRDQDVTDLGRDVEESMRRAYRSLPPDRAERLRRALDDLASGIYRVRQ